MKHLDFSLTGPAGLLIVFCGFALLFGTDPRLVTRILALCVPIVAYVVISHGILRMNQQGRWSVWHGVPVVLCLMLAAAGTFIMLFAVHMKRLLGGAS